MTIINSEKIYSDAAGLWLSGLFSAISGNNPGIDFKEQKDIFFSLLKEWLLSGKIYFCNPDSPLGAPWKADAEEILNFLLSQWPVSADEESDSELNVYFHEMPAILWVQENGEVYDS